MNTNKYLEKDIPMDCQCYICAEEKTVEATPIAKSTHNTCDDCHKEIRPDQWSPNNFTLCIDCG